MDDGSVGRRSVPSSEMVVRARALVVAAVIAIAVSCGGSDEPSDSSTGAPPTSPVEASTQPMGSVNLATMCAGSAPVDLRI